MSIEDPGDAAGDTRTAAAPEALFRLRRLRTAALLALAAGAAGSVGFTLFAGRHTAVPVLLPLFAAWVASPFVILLLLDLGSGRWGARTRASLYRVTLVVAVGSLIAYGIAALGTARPRTQLFVILAPMTWLMIAVLVPLAARLSGRPRR